MAAAAFTKDGVRQAAYNRRLAIPPAYQEQAARDFMQNFLKHVALPPPGAVVSAYMPFNAELNVRPLMAHLLAQGYRIVVPQVVNNLTGLDFRTWTETAPLYRNLHGIEEVSEKHSEVLLPDLMVVPLVAFDEKGNRMGYGSGQFDRTFESLVKSRKEFFTVGAAYDSQREERVPVDEHDHPLDMVVTEKNVYRCRENRA